MGGVDQLTIGWSAGEQLVDLLKVLNTQPKLNVVFIAAHSQTVGF